MPSLVEQLQSDALDPQHSVTNLLRKVKLAAVKLKLNETAEWVDNELNGYSSDAPDYRRASGQLKGWNPYNGWIPIFGDARFMEYISSLRIAQPISQIEDLLRNDADSFRLPLTHRQHQLLWSKMEFQFEMALFITRGHLLRVAESVRNLVLDWAIKLESEGIRGEGVSFSTTEKDRASMTSININSFSGNINSGDVSGTGNRISVGSTDTSTNIINQSTTVFDEIGEAIRSGVEDRSEQQRLATELDRLRSSAGSADYPTAFQRFISQTADYVTLLSPFIPALATLIGAHSAA